MKEIRIDCAHQSEAELALAKEQTQLVFRLNHTMPMTDESSFSEYGGRQSCEYPAYSCSSP